MKLTDGVIIDGCYFPRDVYDRARESARQTGKTRFIAVFYNPPPRSQEAAPARPGDMVELVNTLFAPSRSMTDLSVGAYCTYEVFETRDAVPSSVAFIAWITPRA